MRVEECILVKGKRAGNTGESGMWRQEWVLAARGELSRERESSSHKEVDVQRQDGLQFLPSIARNRRSQTSSSLLKQVKLTESCATSHPVYIWNNVL